MHLHIPKWNKEWSAFINEQIEGEQCLRTIMFLSEETIDKLKDTYFKYAYCDRLHYMKYPNIYSCKVGFSFSNNHIELEIDSEGDIECVTPFLDLDKSEKNYIISLLINFGIQQKILPIIHGEVYIKESMSWCQEF